MSRDDPDEYPKFDEETMYRNVMHICAENKVRKVDIDAIVDLQIE